MTPAINAAKNAKIEYSVHEYQHDPSAKSYGLEAAEKLNISESMVFKTLVVTINVKELAVCIIPVSSKLNMKLVAKALGAKKASMAEATDVKRFTGYVLGGVSPLGQKKMLKTIMDSSANQHRTIFVSAGRRGLEIELDPNDLLTLTKGVFAKICS
jgi:Cys-tRNA(Pro)/Cys-tRNA(Cys) deacylase